MKFKLTANHILYSIALANALRLAWGYAFADADGNILSLPGAFGSLMGSAISVGTAFIAGKLGGKLTKTRKTLTWSAFVILLILEPFILAPITMNHMAPGMKVLLGPGFSWAWAAAMALVPSLVLAGVAVANGGLVEATAQQPLSETSGSLSDNKGGSAKGSSRLAKSSKESAEVHCKYEGAGCKRTGSQAQMNGHAGKCPFKPTISMPEDAKKKEDVNR
jgi:hypothetical protein